MSSSVLLANNNSVKHCSRFSIYLIFISDIIGVKPGQEKEDSTNTDMRLQLNNVSYLNAIYVLAVC